MINVLYKNKDRVFIGSLLLCIFQSLLGGFRTLNSPITFYWIGFLVSIIMGVLFYFFRIGFWKANKSNIAGRALSVLGFGLN